jgi:hypothetical protein
MCCCWENKQSFFLSFFLSMTQYRYRLSHNALPKTITKKYSNNCYLVSLEKYGIPYMKKVTEFREIPRNYKTRNSGEFRRNFSQFRTEYGIDGSKKNRRNSASTEFRGHPTYGRQIHSTLNYATPLLRALSNPY